MPRYEFLCTRCGSFEVWRSFSEADQPQLCPQCSSAAKRTYTSPGLVKTPAALSRARDRAVKSAHEPTTVTRTHHPIEHSTAPVQHSHGRPWQLSH